MENDPQILALVGDIDEGSRRERIRLIHWLLEQGFAVEDIQQASAMPYLLPAQRALGSNDDYISAARFAEMAGIPLDIVHRLQDAVGLPRGEEEEATVLWADAQAIGGAKFFLDIGVSVEDTIIAMRTIADAVGRAAWIVREAASWSLTRQRKGEVELAESISELAQRSAPLLGPMLENLLMLKLRYSFATDAVSAADRLAGKTPGAQRIAVAFADVAGFTRLGQSHPPDALARLAGRLVRLSLQIASPPVRMVKSVGDAVMLVSPDPVLLMAAALDLTDAAGSMTDMPLLRIGVAVGDAVPRGSDWFGHPVNLASRVTSAARPGTILVTASARHNARDTTKFHFTAAGTRKFKGIAEAVEVFWLQRVAGLGEGS